MFVDKSLEQNDGYRVSVVMMAIAPPGDEPEGQRSTT
jgi:hypothetical protein